MSSWQSFLLAWVSAQCLPAVAAEPTPGNIIDAAVFLVGLVVVCIGFNAIVSGCRSLLERAFSPIGQLRTDP